MSMLSLEHIMRRVFEGRKDIIVQNDWGEVTAFQRRWKWGFIPYSVRIAEINWDRQNFIIRVFNDDEALGVFMESKVRKMVDLQGKQLRLYFV